MHLDMTGTLIRFLCKSGVYVPLLTITLRDTFTHSVEFQIGDKHHIVGFIDFSVNFIVCVACRTPKCTSCSPKFSFVAENVTISLVML